MSREYAVLAPPTARRSRAPDIGPARVVLSFRPVGDSQAIPPCPYRGLFAFREIDAPYFFGRETYIARLVKFVQKKQLVTVIGPSGSGKSSLVFAGVVPHLREEGNWLITSFRPSNQPFRTLAAALTPLLESEMSEIDRLIEIKKLAERLWQGELDLRAVIERIVQKHFGARLLLIADQFEELYTLCSPPQEQQRFLDLLLEIGQAQPQQRDFGFNLIITLRADFLGHALSYRRFADCLQDTDVKLGPMTHQELQNAIKKPADKLKVQVDGELTEHILGTISKEPGSLPLLEFALMLLWKKQREGHLTLAAYDEIGGVEHALAVYAEEVYCGLNQKEQKQAQRIFVQLVQPGEGTEDTRRLATYADIGKESWDIVTLLSNVRLVVSGRDESTGDETVEIVHEALIRGWKRLREWIEHDRDFRLWQRLRASLRQWEASSRDIGALLRGVLLVEAEGWMIARPDISPAENAFIEASRKHQEDEIEILNQAAAQKLEKARLQLLLERFPFGIMVISVEDKCITAINPQSLQYLRRIGLVLESIDEAAENIIIGMNSEQVLRTATWYGSSGAIVPYEEQPLFFALQKGMASEAELQIVGTDNEILYLLVNATPLNDHDGTITSVVLTWQDITDRKIFEHAREDFVATTAHELKTPLANLRAHLAELSSRDLKWSEEERFDILSTADEQIERLVRMVNQFLDATRIVVGALRLDLEVISLTDLFEDLQERFEALISSSRRQLEVNISAYLPNVQADYELIMAALENLLVHALRCTPEGDVVRLEAKTVYGNNDDQPLGVELRVIDRGPIVVPEQQAELFTRFSKFASQREARQNRLGRIKNLARSVGLGLYISRGIIETHGSTLKLEGDLIQGNIFSFILFIFAV